MPLLSTSTATGFRTLAVGCFLLIASGCDLPFAPGADQYVDDLRIRRGTLVTVDTVWVDTLRVETGDLVIRDIHLTSTSGLRVRMRVRTPADAGAQDRRPLVVLIGGIERGGTSIDLIPRELPQIGASLWYPEWLDEKDAAYALRRLDRLPELVWDIPASILLALDHLAAMPEVDLQRIALVGASFGGFFAPAVAAADPRIANLGLLYTGGDLGGLLASNFRKEVPPAAAVLGAEMAALPLQRLEPTRYMRFVAPRHVLLVNGLYDDKVDLASARAIMEATRPPKDIVWLPTGHLEPADEPFLRELVDTALARLPVLQNR